MLDFSMLDFSMLDFLVKGDEIPKPIQLAYMYSALIIYLFAFIEVKRYKYNNRNVVKTFILMTVMTILAVFYCLNTDYFSYRSIVTNSYYLDVDLHVEKFYSDLAHFCKGNYELFRMIVWGGAILILSFICFITRVNSTLVLFVWFLFFYHRLFYARVTLAFSVFFFGLIVALTYRKQKPIMYSGIIIMILSLFFHKTMLILLAVTPVIFLKINKSNYKRLIIITFVLTIPFVMLLLGDTRIVSGLTGDQNIGESISLYNSRISEGRYSGGASGFNIFGIIGVLYRQAFFYVLLYIIGRKILAEKIENDNDRLKDSNYRSFVMVRLFRISFAIILLATVFLITMGFNNVYFYRILYMSILPMCLLFIYLFQNKKISKKTVYIMLLYSILVHYYDWRYIS